MVSIGRTMIVIGLAGLLTSCTTFNVDSMMEEDKAAIASSDSSSGSAFQDEDPGVSDNSSASAEDFQKTERTRREQLRDMEYGRPVKTQTIQSLEGMSEVDEAYWHAKSIKPQEGKRLDSKQLYDDQKIMTDREVVRSILPANVLDQKIDLDFDEIKLGDIFMTIGKAGGINIVLDPQYKNQMTDLHLKQVTIEEALTLVTSSYNLGMKIVENSVFITSNDKLREEKMVSKVVRLKNIPASEAKTMIEGLVDSVSSSEQINTLIVRGLPDQMVKVDRLIDIIDIPQPQVLIEAKIIEVNKDALRDLGVDWSDQIVLSAQEGGRDVEIEDNANPLTSLYRIGRFERTPIQFSTIIKMLETQNKAKLLANPRISTLNGKDAEIFVGDKVPYTVTTVTGGVATTEVRFVEPGIRLKITPSIVEDDFVVMEVEPEVSFIFAFRGENSDVPQVKTREARANVRIKNKETVVIGGLIDQEDKENLSKVPFIGDLPLIGNIFTYQKRTILDTELIITVTPTVVRGEI